MKNLIIILSAASLAAGGAAQAQAQNRNPSGNPLSSIFSCQNANNKQGTGAIIGGVIGGVVGNKLSDDKKNNTTRNTVLGAALGAAAGSMIGRRMGGDDGQRAQTATQTALQQGRSQTWQNTRTGATGRVDIIDTYNYGADSYVQPFSMTNVRWQQGVERPRDYEPVNVALRAANQTPLRAGPSGRSRQLGALRAGDVVDGLVRIQGTDWVLVGQGGTAIGYVSESAMQETRRGRPLYDPRGGQMCRTFDQTYVPRGGQAETQRYQACQTVSGDWVIQNA